LIDLAIVFGVLVILLGIYGFMPLWRALLVLPLILLGVVTAVGCGLLLAAVNIWFRDVRYALPFLIQLWMFATPIAYPSSLIKNDLLRSLYGLNPMSGVGEGMRWALLGTKQAPGAMVAASAAIAFVLLVTGAQLGLRVLRLEAQLVLRDVEAAVERVRAALG
jgi:lipopolysaccharide transport system permease protein